MKCYDLDAGKANITVNVDAANDKVKVTSNDTESDYLFNKVVAGTNITVTELNDGGVETLEISASGGGGGTDDIAISQGFHVQDIITSDTLTSNVDDWNPTGFDADTDMIRVDINQNNRSISGVIAPASGVNRILAIKNINTSSKTLKFEHNNAGSTSVNRFLCRDNNNKSIKPNETALWFYDHIVLRWTPYNRIG